MRTLAIIVLSFICSTSQALAFAIYQHPNPNGLRLEVSNPLKEKLMEYIPLPPQLKIDASNKKVYAKLTLKFN